MTPLFDIAERLYKSMLDNSTVNEHGEQIFEGSILELYRDTGASSSYYSMVRTVLQSPAVDPCIELRRKGNAHQASLIVLRHAPDAGLKNILPGDLTSPRIGSRMESVERRLAVVESWRESSFREVNILEILADFERRLSSLEGERAEWQDNVNSK